RRRPHLTETPTRLVFLSDTVHDSTAEYRQQQSSRVSPPSRWRHLAIVLPSSSALPIIAVALARSTVRQSTLHTP
ncbi:hypothetical protein ACLOJK_008481, partial [Asimina triloba]